MTTTVNPKARIAVIGSGAAGLTAAWLLRTRYSVTLLERNEHLGGHAFTVDVRDGENTRSLDLGFMVFNHRNYPLFTKLLNSLGGIAIGESEMSFGYYTPTENAGYLVNWDAAERRPTKLSTARNLLPDLLPEIVRFCRTALADLRGGQLAGLSLGDYLGQGGYSRQLADRYAVAMGSAIWSTPAQSLLQFPAEPFLRFFANHGMLDFADSPQWLHIHGGSRSYVQAIAATLAGNVRLATPVERVERNADGVSVRTADGAVESFDHVVFAVHADEVLPLLGNPTPDEQDLFAAWRYERNSAVLHVDSTVMPPDPALWASWNYRDEGDASRQSLSVTYDLTRLQQLDDAGRSYFLTLNPTKAIPAEHVLGNYAFTHPVYSPTALGEQPRLASLNGRGPVWYCGSYFGYGFHEDAVRSGMDVARGLGVEL